jgi:ABC-2 type transport system permease protein
MIVASIASAIIYRELVWIRRFLADYIVSWLLSLIYPLGVVVVPSALSGSTTVVERFSALYGIEMSLGDVYTIVIILTGMINVVSVIMYDIIGTLFTEFKLMDVGPMILEASSIARYAILNAILRPLIMALFSTTYLAPLLLFISGYKGLLEFLIIELALILSAVALGLYASIFATLLIFFTSTSRPWTIVSVLTSAILAGTGIYIPTELVPLVLRLIAFTTPVPQTCRALFAIAFKGFSQVLVAFGSVLAFSIVLYLGVSGALLKYAEFKVRKGWK